MRRFFLVGAMFAFAAGSASAQTCGGAIPNTLVNGATADATQVMANFNYLVTCIGSLRGYLAGLTLSNDTSNPNTVIDTAAGLAESDDATTMMTGAALTKNADAGWSAGTGNGCLDSGTSLAASTWYHVYLIARTDTGVVDELCSISPTSPSMPTSYTKKRRLGSFKTDASAHIIAFEQRGDQFMWFDPPADAAPGTVGTSPALLALSVPPGVFVTAVFNVSVLGPPSGTIGLTVWPDHDNFGSGGTYVVAATGAGSISSAQMHVPVFETSAGQVQIVSSTSSTSYYVYTTGWIDTRGRFN